VNENDRVSGENEISSIFANGHLPEPIRGSASVGVLLLVSGVFNVSPLADH
jgi:hypothetical protein